MKTGKVYLVGAGPGDSGLLTVRALSCLSQADVVIYDRLIDSRILAMSPPKAEKIYVGKAVRNHTSEQTEINQLLIQKAKERKTIVRLKGGDPFVLGRGGEEAAVLADNHIPFEVVPGISSAVAVPAYAGIPVTHRGIASSFAVITGHEDPQKRGSSINWAKLATGVDTLVFLMGVNNLAEIMAKLVEYGRSPGTPVAVIKDGTQPAQTTIVGSIENIVAKVQKEHLRPPAVIIVGEVVRLRKKLRWFDNRPLFGKRILVTRARRQASALSDLLIAHGAEPVELPAIDIKPLADTAELDKAITNLHNYHWIVFTSVNGVTMFFQQLCSKHQDARAFCGLKVGAIGPATARALEAKGIMPDYIPRVYTSRGIIAGLKKHGISGQRFLIPRADIADDELVQGIRKLDAEVAAVASYQTVSANSANSQVKQMLSSGEIDVITFTSSSTVSSLVAMLGNKKQLLHHARIACIGPKTADTATSAGLNVDIIAREHTIPGLVAAIEEYFSKET